MNASSVENAIIAVTLNCNSRCTMCDIWKNKMKNEVKPNFFSKLPSTLKDINITGGEPFLRADLPEIVAVMKKTCPQAKILANTNGFTPKLISHTLKNILQVDPQFGLRISLDGWGKRHDEIRGITGGFDKCLETLRIARQLGVRDLGIAFTLMKSNVSDLVKLFYFAKKNHYAFSLTLVSESPIYFGKGKESLRPDDSIQVKQAFQTIISQQYNSFNIKAWFKAWFNKNLFNYFKTGVRKLPCEAGKNFIYIDSYGKVYGCHMRSWLMGDLKKKTFLQIEKSKLANKTREKVSACDGCWMVCSAKSSIEKNLFLVSFEIIKDKLSLIFFNKTLD